MNPKRFLILLIIATLVATAGLSIYIYNVVSHGLPSLQQLENPEQMFASQIVSNDGDVFDHFYMQRRVQIPLEQIPKDLVNALIATEDRKFYSHWGLDIDRLFKATLKNILTMKVKEGASTITQQLSRNLFLDQSRNIERKIREAAVAVKIEDTYTKDEILEMYLNTVNFGRGSYGIYVAAKTFFNKEPLELSTAECAYLIGLLKAPSRYDARNNYDRALSRRNLILGMMYDESHIDRESYLNSISEPIELNAGDATKGSGSKFAAHYVENIRKSFGESLREQEIDIYTDGLIFYTSLNSKIQKYAEDVVKLHMTEYQNKFDKRWNWDRNKKLLNEIVEDAIKQHPSYKTADKNNKKTIASRFRKDKEFIDSLKNQATTIQLGLVVMDPTTGAILAMVGASPKFMDENFHAKFSLNHVTQIRRQPGSSLKPFIYTMSLMNGMIPEDSIGCGPFTYIDPWTEEIWQPKTGTRDCPDTTDKMTLAEGLRRSVNSVAARLITEKTTPQDVRDLLVRAGINTKIDAVPALALGAGGDIVPIELVSAYSIFANDGYRVEPYYVDKIENKNGDIIYRKKRNNKLTDVLERDIAHEMTILMKDVVDRGTAIRVRNYFKGIEAAGKTGTTNDNTDAWFIGYTPELICGIWVGFDDRRVNFNPIGDDGQGGRAAAPIWGMLMEKVYADDELNYHRKTFGYKSRKELDSLSKLERKIGNMMDIFR